MKSSKLPVRAVKWCGGAKGEIVSHPVTSDARSGNQKNGTVPVARCLLEHE